VIDLPDPPEIPDDTNGDYWRGYYAGYKDAQDKTDFWVWSAIILVAAIVVVVAVYGRLIA
jgi:hypothetical protein